MADDGAAICLFNVAIAIHVNSKVIHATSVESRLNGRVQLVNCDKVHCIRLSLTHVTTQ